MEIWVTHATVTTPPRQYLPILTLGTTTASSTGGYSASYNSNFELMRYGSKYAIAVRSADVGASASILTSTMSTVTENSAAPIQIVLTVSAPVPSTGASSVYLYINDMGGESLGSVNLPTTNTASSSATFTTAAADYTQWSSSYKLQLFSDYRTAAAQTANAAGSYNVWPGSVYLALWYIRVLTAAEITANYNAGTGSHTVLGRTELAQLRVCTSVRTAHDCKEALLPHARTLRRGAKRTFRLIV